MSSNSFESLCRACLASKVRMYDVRNTPLQRIFEDLTGKELLPGDIRNSVCYVCCARLQSFWRFQDMVRCADEEFAYCLARDIKMGFSLSSLQRSAVDILSLPEVPAAEDLVCVKVESGVKQELDFEGDVQEYTTEADFTSFPDIKVDIDLTSERSESPHTEIYHCSVCLKELYNLHQLKTHEKSHEIETCHLCKEKYPKSRRDNHMRKHTKPFQCNICPKTFSEQSSLIKHSASHSDKKIYFCDTCDRGFTHKTYLRNHLRTHTGEKPFVCQLCGKPFAQIGHLITHKQTHEKKLYKNASQSKYFCELCSKAYSFKNSLNRHMRKHANIKPFKCEVCGRCFLVGDTLKTHMRRHTGEKPFECFCGKRFSTRGNCTKHEKTHLNNND